MGIKKLDSTGAHAPAIGEHNQDILDDFTFGLENLRDSNEIVEQQNNNIRKNTEGKENLLWPNKNLSRTLSMAQGLDALEALGNDDYKAATPEIPIQKEK